jgi:hypothetical protein
MSHTAKGPFDVKLSPQPLAVDDAGGGAARARLALDKRYQGDLDATSNGEMLSAMTETQGSAGYVAIEKVTGTLAGRSGSFALQHNGTMTRGTPKLEIIVVPDSGSGGLEGLSGSMRIVIAEGGKHFYEFDYTLDSA